MRQRSLLFLLSFLTLIGSRIAVPIVSVAQEISSGMATYVEVLPHPKTGDIISFTNKGFQPSKVAYDPTVFGVVTENPALSLESIAGRSKASVAVVSSGKTYLRVSAENGQIKKGDLLTSSNRPGVAQKATQNGFVVGTAMEDFQPSNAKSIGTVLVTLNFGFNTLPTNIRANLLQQLKTATVSPFLSPINTLRYVLAGLCILISFLLGIGIFGKVSVMGVEAIGRNPLASKVILFSIFINVLLTIATMSVGIAIAYLILVL